MRNDLRSRWSAVPPAPSPTIGLHPRAVGSLT